jgi:hypothetical protein
MAIHRLGCDLHHVGLRHHLGDEDFWRSMASRYGCEDGESDGRMIVYRTVTVHEIARDSLDRQTFLLVTPGYHDTRVFVRDDGKIMRFSGATI